MTKVRWRPYAPLGATRTNDDDDDDQGKINPDTGSLIHKRVRFIEFSGINTSTKLSPHIFKINS